MLGLSSSLGKEDRDRYARPLFSTVDSIQGADDLVLTKADLF